MFCSQDLEEKDEKPFSYLSSVFHAKNASAYLVNGAYLDTIIKLYEWAIPLLESTGEIKNIQMMKHGNFYKKKINGLYLIHS